LASAAPAAVQRAGLRPEHLHLAETGQGIPATVVLAEHLGDSSILHLQVKGVAELLHAKVDAKASHCETGQIVAIAPDGGWTLMFGADGRLIG
jgi:multiple sugar transport system ATP-binding protein